MPGRYESHYLRAVDPARPRGAWIRHTSHERPGEAPTGALWCTVWDAEAGPPYAVKQSLPAPPGTRFAGRAEAQGRCAAWDLEPAGAQTALRHLPRAWMYRAPLPRTKLESPLPDAVFTGAIEYAGTGAALDDSPRTPDASPRAAPDASSRTPDASPRAAPDASSPAAPDTSPDAAPDDSPRTSDASSRATSDASSHAARRRIEVAGWRGVVGHNWGSEHAERWVWLHALGFAEAPGAWLDVALARVRVAGRTSPWVAYGAIQLDGSRLRLGGLGRVRSTRVEARPGALEAVIGGAAATVRVSVAAPLDQTVAFVYADPGGGEHHALNCSIAQVRLRVERPGRPPVELATAFGGAYELGMRESDHGVPVQPFPDP